MKTYRRFLTLALCLLLLIPALGLCAQAKDLDEIPEKVREQIQNIE